MVTGADVLVLVCAKSNGEIFYRTNGRILRVPAEVAAPFLSD